MRGRCFVAALTVVAVLMPGSPMAGPDPAEPARTQMAQDSSSDDANISTSKRKKALTLIEYAGTKAQAEAMIDQVFKVFLPRIKKNNPDLNQDDIGRLKDVVRSVFLENIDGLRRKMVPVYAQNFTDSEIERLIDFFETPVGQKYAERLPTMMRQIGQIGRAWAKELQPELRLRVREALK